MPDLPPLEEFKAPWEVDASGVDIPEEDQQIDRGVLKKLIWNLRSDKAKQAGTITTLTTERDALKTEVDSKKREGESEVDRLKRELADRDNALAEAGKTSKETMRLRAALKVGLRPEHVGRLVGETEEELEADAKVLLDSFGAGGKSEEKDPPRGRPRPRRTPGDPDPEAGDDLSVEAMLAAVPRNHF